MKIRPYKESLDFEEICEWSRHDFDGKAPVSSQFSETTFIAETDDDEMAGVLSVLLTNCKHMAILDCLFTNPSLPTRVRKEAIECLITYSELFAGALEYKGVFGWTEKANMARHYNKLGFEITLDEAFTVYKKVEGE